MGISKATGAAATLFLIASCYLRKAGMSFLMLPFLYCSIVACVVTVASHNAVNLPLILGKSTDGRFPLWSIIIFAPFLILARLYVLIKAAKRKEPRYSEISEGLYVGGWPNLPEHLPPGSPAVIDCTCELPRRSFIAKDDYLCIATWDTRSPLPSQMESAVCWALKKKAMGKPVYVHCAFGHGRSVSIVTAIVAALGLADDWKDAEKLIRMKRPNIKMNALHRKSLEEWTANQHSLKQEN